MYERIDKKVASKAMELHRKDIVELEYKKTYLLSNIIDEISKHYKKKPEKTIYVIVSACRNIKHEIISPICGRKTILLFALGKTRIADASPNIITKKLRKLILSKNFDKYDKYVLYNILHYIIGSENMNKIRYFFNRLSMYTVRLYNDNHMEKYKLEGLCFILKFIECCDILPGSKELEELKKEILVLEDMKKKFEETIVKDPNTFSKIPTVLTNIYTQFNLKDKKMNEINEMFNNIFEIK
jgi:hypothetical protein